MPSMSELLQENGRLQGLLSDAREECERLRGLGSLCGEQIEALVERSRRLGMEVLSMREALEFITKEADVAQAVVMASETLEHIEEMRRIHKENGEVAAAANPFSEDGV